MTKAHLDNEEFFARLATLFETRQKQGHGSIFLTQKRFSQHDSTAEKPKTSLTPVPYFADLHIEKPLPVLIRATDGKSREQRKERIKLSTLVQDDELEGFYVKYTEVCKAGMSGLKKRDRSGRKAKDKKKKKQKEIQDGEKKV